MAPLPPESPPPSLDTLTEAFSRTHVSKMPDVFYENSLNHPLLLLLRSVLLSMILYFSKDVPIVLL